MQKQQKTQQILKRYLVTVWTSEGLLLLDRLMVDAVSFEQAERAAKSCAVDQANWTNPQLIGPWLNTLQIRTEEQD